MDLDAPARSVFHNLLYNIIYQIAADRKARIKAEGGLIFSLHRLIMKARIHFNKGGGDEAI